MSGKKGADLTSRKFDCKELVSRFALAGTPLSAKAYGSGHIHETYLLRTRERECPDYILQRINTNVFTDVPRLMENIVRVTEHLRRKIAAIPGADPDREVLRVVPNRDGQPFHRDGAGNYWRCYIFIEHLASERQADKPRAGIRGGKTFRTFHRAAERPARTAPA